MKQYINFFMLALSITCNLQASLSIKYWNDNVHKPKSTIQKNIPLKEKCNLILAMIRERKTVNLEKSIPLLMEIYTKEVHTLPEVELAERDKLIVKEVETNVASSSRLITEGATYETCKAIINKEPLLQKHNISLYYINNNFVSARTKLSIIQYGNSFLHSSDALKLFILHHELQHQLNGDTDNRRVQAELNNKCSLADLKNTPYVQAILKSGIKNIQGQNLQDVLNENGESLEKECSRYREFKADTGAIQNMHCPLCVQEASMYRPETNDQRYQPDGHIERWQFQPRIDQLKKQGTICQHHHENGEQIDTSICDGSTLAGRLKIIQK